MNYHGLSDDQIDALCAQRRGGNPSGFTLLDPVPQGQVLYHHIMQNHPELLDAFYVAIRQEAEREFLEAQQDHGWSSRHLMDVDVVFASPRARAVAFLRVTDGSM